MTTTNTVLPTTTSDYLATYDKGAGNTANMLGGRGALSDYCVVEGNMLTVDYKDTKRTIELTHVQVESFATRYIFTRLKDFKDDARDAFLDSIEGGYMELAHKSSIESSTRSKKAVSNPLAKRGKVISSSDYLVTAVTDRIATTTKELASSLDSYKRLSEASTKKDITMVLDSLVESLLESDSLMSYREILANEEAAKGKLESLEAAGFTNIKQVSAGFSASLDMSLAKTFQKSLAVENYKLLGYNANLETGLLDITFGEIEDLVL